MGATEGVTPLQKSFQTCLADNNACDESERGAIETALDQAIRTDLAAIPQALAPIFEDRKGIIAQPLRDLIRNKLTTAYSANPSSYATALMKSANDANGLTGDEFAIVYNDAGLHERMNNDGAGIMNGLLSSAIALHATGTKIWIDDEVLAHLEKSLIDYGVSKELIAQYRGLGISKPEIKATADVKPAPKDPDAARKAEARRKKAAEERRKKETEAKRAAEAAAAAAAGRAEKKDETKGAGGSAPAGDIPQDL